MKIEVYNEKVTSLVFVEGKDDEVFLKLFLQHLGLTEPLQVIRVEGKDRNRLKLLLQALKIDPLFENIRAIGIVRDADQNALAVKQSVQAVLNEVAFAIPISIFIMPPNAEGTGQMLEDLLWAYFEEINDPHLTCVLNYINCLIKSDESLPAHRIPKARFYALLAAKKDPTEEEEAFLAFRRHVKHWDAQAFDPIKAFLTELASL